MTTPIPFKNIDFSTYSNDENKNFYFTYIGYYLGDTSIFSSLYNSNGDFSKISKTLFDKNKYNLSDELEDLYYIMAALHARFSSKNPSQAIGYLNKLKTYAAKIATADFHLSKCILNIPIIKGSNHRDEAIENYLANIKKDLTTTELQQSPDFVVNEYIEKLEEIIKEDFTPRSTVFYEIGNTLKKNKLLEKAKHYYILATENENAPKYNENHKESEYDNYQASLALISLLTTELKNISTIQEIAECYLTACTLAPPDKKEEQFQVFSKYYETLDDTNKKNINTVFIQFNLAQKMASEKKTKEEIKGLQEEKKFKEIFTKIFEYRESKNPEMLYILANAYNEGYESNIADPKNAIIYYQRVLELPIDTPNDEIYKKADDALIQLTKSKNSDIAKQAKKAILTLKKLTQPHYDYIIQWINNKDQDALRYLEEKLVSIKKTTEIYVSNIPDLCKIKNEFLTKPITDFLGNAFLSFIGFTCDSQSDFKTILNYINIITKSLTASDAPNFQSMAKKAYCDLVFIHAPDYRKGETIPELKGLKTEHLDYLTKEANNKNGYAHYCLAQIFELQNDVTKAIKHYKKAVVLQNPESVADVFVTYYLNCRSSAYQVVAHFGASREILLMTWALKNMLKQKNYSHSELQKIFQVILALENFKGEESQKKLEIQAFAHFCQATLSAFSYNADLPNQLTEALTKLKSIEKDKNLEQCLNQINPILKKQKIQLPEFFQKAIDERCKESAKKPSSNLLKFFKKKENASNSPNSTTQSMTTPYVFETPLNEIHPPKELFPEQKQDFGTNSSIINPFYGQTSLVVTPPYPHPSAPPYPGDKDNPKKTNTPVINAIVIKQIPASSAKAAKNIEENNILKNQRRLSF